MASCVRNPSAKGELQYDRQRYFGRGTHLADGHHHCAVGERDSGHSIHRNDVTYDGSSVHHQHLAPQRPLYELAA